MELRARSTQKRNPLIYIHTYGYSVLTYTIALREANNEINTLITNRVARAVHKA